MSPKPPVSTTEKTLLENVWKFFHAHLISPERGIIVAFSGGADSLSLLHILISLYGKEHIRPLYVDHYLRSRDEQEREIEENRRRCTEMGLSLEIICLGKGTVAEEAKVRGNGIEEAARHLRYAALLQAKEKSGFRYIATAHTRTDVLETLLMRTFQGSRLHLGSSIRPITEDSVIRPLLDVPRSMLEEYLAAKGLSGVYDSTNDNTDFLRNGVRRTLVPALDEVFPGWGDGLLRVSDEFEKLNEFADAEAQRLLSSSLEVVKEGEEIFLKITDEMIRSDSLLRRILYGAFSFLSFPSPLRLSEGQVGAILERVMRRSEGRVETPSSYVSIQKGVLVWKKGEMPLSSGYASLVYSQETPLSVGMTLCCQVRTVDPEGDRDAVWIPRSVVKGDLIVRSAREGDSIRLKRGSKKLSSLFTEWKIPVEKRWEIPLLCDDEGILALLGRQWGGRDRVAARVLEAPLAPDETTLYSVRKDKGHDCG